MWTFMYWKYKDSVEWYMIHFVKLMPRLIYFIKI